MTLEELKDGERAILDNDTARSVVITLNALYSGKFRGQSMECSDTRRDLANFLYARLDSGALVVEADHDA